MKIIKNGTRYYVVNDQNMAISMAVTRTGCQNVINNINKFRTNALTASYIDALIDFCSKKCADMMFAAIDEFKYGDVASGDAMRDILAKTFKEVYKVEFNYTADPYSKDRPAAYKVHVAGYGFFGSITTTLHRPGEEGKDDFFASVSHTIRKYKNVI